MHPSRRRPPRSPSAVTASTACPRPSRWPPTASPPRRSPTPSATPTPDAATSTSSLDGDLDRRDRRRRRRASPRSGRPASVSPRCASEPSSSAVPALRDQRRTGTTRLGPPPADRALDDHLPDPVAIADDHPIVRDGLRALLESRPEVDVVGEAGRRRRHRRRRRASPARRRHHGPAHARHERHRRHPPHRRRTARHRRPGADHVRRRRHRVRRAARRRPRLPPQGSRAGRDRASRHRRRPRRGNLRRHRRHQDPRLLRPHPSGAGSARSPS